MFMGSRPLRRQRGGISGIRRGAKPSTDSRIARMCAGVVPQQPPTMFRKPLWANSASTSAMSSGVSSYSPNALGSPALG